MYKRLLKPVIKHALPTGTRRRVLRFRIWILTEVHRQSEPVYSIDCYDRLRCIHFHIPKNAGISVSHALFGNRGAGHITVEEAQLIFGMRKFRAYFKFAFTRNPFDRLVSAYFHLKRGGMQRRVSPWIERTILPYEAFSDFVRHGLRNEDVRSDLHFRPQHSFICDRRGKLQTDFLGRFERLDRDFATVAATLGVNAELPELNKSDRQPYQSYYDSTTEKIVANLYDKDLRLFGYEF